VARLDRAAGTVAAGLAAAG